MHPMLNVAVRAARRAGRIINRASLDLENLQVARKQANDFVTELKLSWDAQGVTQVTVSTQQREFAIFGSASSF